MYSFRQEQPVIQVFTNNFTPWFANSTPLKENCTFLGTIIFTNRLTWVG